MAVRLSKGSRRLLPAEREPGRAASLRAQDRDAALVEAARVLFGGDFEVHREDEVCPGEVQVDGQRHLQGRWREALLLVEGRAGGTAEGGHCEWGPRPKGNQAGEGGSGCSWDVGDSRYRYKPPFSRSQTQTRRVSLPTKARDVPPTTLAFFSALVCLAQRSCVRGRAVEMALESESLLLLHVAPCSFRPAGAGRGAVHRQAGLLPRSRARHWGGPHPYSPVTPKLQASRAAFCRVVTLTSRQSSSRDQLLAWATYCLVAVMYASGTNRPPRHTWMFCGKRQAGEGWAPQALLGQTRASARHPPPTSRPRGGCSRAQHSRRPFPRPLWCVGTTFSSLAPPDAAASEMFCSCLILSLKSDTHWMTVMPAGTV